MARIRLDKILLKRNIAQTIEKSVELIESGEILVNGSVQLSPKSFVDSGSAIEMLPKKAKYVSRGGTKLEHALEFFNINPRDKRCLDIGASTGGFTDCLLRQGAKHVVALDVGHGQIELVLRNDKRVSVFEKTNAKDITPDMIGGVCELGVMDVSFTSVSLLIPSVTNCLSPKELIVLIKPQFECEPKFVNQRGVVTDVDAQIDCVINVGQSLPENLDIVQLCTSPIKGAKGNIEFLAHITERKNESEALNTSRIRDVIKSSIEQLEV